MSIDFHVVRHETYLECIVTGNFELEEAKRAFVRLLQVWAESRIPGLLVDIRQLVVTTPISFRERFDFAQHAARAAIHSRARGLVVTRAVILGTDVHVDPRRIGATVATNRGARVHVTTDEAEALACLGIEKTEKRDHESPAPTGG